MRQLLIISAIFVFFILFLLGCTNTQDSCGNGTCEAAKENSNNCPIDCGLKTETPGGVGSVGARATEITNPTNPSFSNLKNVAVDLKSVMQKNGYWVGDGKYSFMTADNTFGMLMDFNNGFGLNAASPYGSINLPRAPGEYTTPFNDPDFSSAIGMPDSNLLFYWRLRSDEAIVLIGLTPPESKYYSFINYLLTRDYQNAKSITKLSYELVTKELFADSSGTITIPGLDENSFMFNASFGIPLNNKVIKTSNPQSPFLAATVIIITADKTMNAKISALLQNDKNGLLKKYGLSTNIINTLEIPANYMYLGYDENADVFYNYNRMSYVKDVSAKNDYITNPPFAVLRIVPQTPEDKSISKKYTFTDLPSKTSAINKNEYNSALSSLIEAVKIKEGNANRILSDEFQPMYPGFLKIKNCVNFAFTCAGDDQDCAYGFFPSQKPFLTKNSDDVLVLVGMNHVKTGKVIYSNFTVYDGNYNLGIKSIGDEDMLGSATEYLPYLNNVNASSAVKNILTTDTNKFFVYKLSRDCLNKPYCYSIPELIAYCNEPGWVYGDSCPKEKQVYTPGAKLNDFVMTYERAYLDPTTNIGPDYNQLLPTTYLHYKPKDTNYQ